ncbi:N/A [soil metagenome]
MLSAAYEHSKALVTRPHWMLRIDSIKIALLAVGCVRHWSTLYRMYRTPTGTALSHLLVDRPEVYGMVLTPFVNSKWSAAERLKAVIGHCSVADRLQGPFNQRHDEYFTISRLSDIGEDYRVTLDAPRWLLREGLMCLSLWEADKRIYSISFTLSETNGLTAYVGGLQGASVDGIADIYRRFTKASFGIRPRDMIITLFNIVCQAIDVAEILAISDAARHQLSRYSLARARGIDPVNQSYDKVWLERGGIPGDNGFFSLPLEWSRRKDEDIPPNKRAQYRRRYAMLDNIHQEIAAVFARPRNWVPEHFL